MNSFEGKGGGHLIGKSVKLFCKWRFLTIVWDYPFKGMVRPKIFFQPSVRAQKTGACRINNVSDKQRGSPYRIK